MWVHICIVACVCERLCVFVPLCVVMVCLFLCRCMLVCHVCIFAPLYAWSKRNNNRRGKVCYVHGMFDALPCLSICHAMLVALFVYWHYLFTHPQVGHRVVSHSFFSCFLLCPLPCAILSIMRTVCVYPQVGHRVVCFTCLLTLFVY